MPSVYQCNSSLYGLPSEEISKLLRLQNSAARLVLKSKVQDHITLSLEKLHWRPVDHRIIFKVLLMTFKTMNGCPPEYLSDLLDTYVPMRSLRSATQGLLVVPKSFTSTYGDRAFSVAAPKLWNNLPGNIRTTSILDYFKRKLETQPFQNAFL